MRIPSDSKLLFIGDSITDAGRSDCGETTPWDPQLGLGHGYVNLVNAFLSAEHAAQNIRVLNKGVSGHTVLDLKARWDEDVLAHQPDWLSVKIGINDVWRHFDTPQRTESHVGPELFEQTLRELLDKTRPQLKGLILMSPYLIETNLNDPMRQQMDAYGAIVKAVAADFDAIFVDTQTAIDRVLKDVHPTALAWDRIHPGTTGHMILARAFLAAIGNI
jgi:lysophospholipase L1-like esterase|tara:strand:+ start:532 stop:1185 length:654 start_codon:yes stop_codon:yes gene_type:complete